MTNEHTQLAYIGRKGSLSSSAVNSRIDRGGSGGGVRLKHMLTVHPLMFRVGAVCGGLDNISIHNIQHKISPNVHCLWFVEEVIQAAVQGFKVTVMFVQNVWRSWIDCSHMPENPCQQLRKS